MEQTGLKAVVGSYRDPVLIVEDKKENQDLLQGICKRANIRSDTAANGEIAIEMAKQHKYSVYIVDLMMPVMDGKTFIKLVKEIDPSAVIIVQTALNNSDTIIEIMRLGVYDYIIKPIDPEIFSVLVVKAIEYKYLKELEMMQSMSAGQKIRNQIEWLNYKESRRMTAQDATSEAKSIYSLKTSLAQGAGFGTLITLIDLMKSAMEANDDHYKIDKQILDMIIDNNEYCRKQLEGLSYATDIMDKDFELVDSDVNTFVRSIPQMIERIVPHFREKNINITYPEVVGNHKIRYNPEIMSIVIEELVVNAYKYSSRDSTINVFAHANQGYFWVNVKNDVPVKPYGGIPKDLEKLVLEPFFRIHPPDESVAKVERIGFGLGLAVVDYVAKKHGGIFIIHDVTDLTSDRQKSCVLAELLLPIWA